MRASAAESTAAHTDAPIVGDSPATTQLRAEIARAARFSSNVLVSGPSGAGKELVARSLHQLGPRASGPFIPVDCASLSGELMASQLFGHVAGAFTGANCDALGCFRAAHQGTIFLDEIGEMEFPLQAKLLRVLQERVVTPIGSFQGQLVDVRVVAATNRDLREEVRAGRFREDLYYRLRVVHLHAAPLRERLEDIPALAAAILDQLAAEGLPRCTLSAEAGRALAAFSWPGNVRQLRNLLEQAVIEAVGPSLGDELVAELLEDNACRETDESPARVDVGATTIEPAGSQVRWHVMEDGEVSAPSALTESAPSWASLSCIERDHLIRTLEHTFYNRSAAARLLGITRQSLLRKIERHGIVIPDASER